MFFVKLDMVFNDTICLSTNPCLRVLMMAQKGLAPLDHLLLRTRFRYQWDIEMQSARYRPGPGTERIPVTQRECLYWEHNQFRHPNGLAFRNESGFIVIHGHPVAPLNGPDTMILAEAARRHINIDKAQMTFFITWGWSRPLTKPEGDDLDGFFGLTPETIATLPSTDQRPFWWKAFREMCNYDRALHWSFDLSREGLTKTPRDFCGPVSAKQHLDRLRKREDDTMIDFEKRDVVQGSLPRDLMPQLPGDENLMQLMARVSKAAGMTEPKPKPPPPKPKEPEPQHEEPVEEPAFEEDPVVIHGEPPSAELDMEDFEDFDVDFGIEDEDEDEMSFAE